MNYSEIKLPDAFRWCTRAGLSDSNSLKTGEAERYTDMLRSDDLELILKASKCVRRAHAYDKYLLDILDAEIWESYLEVSKWATS